MVTRGLGSGYSGEHSIPGGDDLLRDDLSRGQKPNGRPRENPFLGVKFSSFTDASLKSGLDQRRGEVGRSGIVWSAGLFVLWPVGRTATTSTNATI